MVVTISSFQFRQVRGPLLRSLLMMSGRQFIQSQSTALLGLRQCWSLITSCNRSQSSSRV